jgi:hypothetical protein
MNLEDFVRDTLVQIVNGVVAAGKATADSGAKLSPANIIVLTSNGVPHPVVNVSAPAHPHVEMIDFDVAVYATEGGGVQGGGGLKVATLFELSGQKKSEFSSGSESRIRFKIPVVLPATGTTPPPRKTRSMRAMQADANQSR